MISARLVTTFVEVPWARFHAKQKLNITYQIIYFMSISHIFYLLILSGWKRFWFEFRMEYSVRHIVSSRQPETFSRLKEKFKLASVNFWSNFTFYDPVIVNSLTLSILIRSYKICYFRIQVIGISEPFWMLLVLLTASFCCFHQPNLKCIRDAKNSIESYFGCKNPFIGILRDELLWTLDKVFSMLRRPNYFSLVLVINHCIILKWRFE